mmetsp:Transcript_30971/g.77470  ORF Transcript_30971/g.77470 Transcript_30971/m.77470 type:complete len:211 (-) Transcript_30971:270-902(-)
MSPIVSVLKPAARMVCSSATATTTARREDGTSFAYANGSLGTNSMIAIETNMISIMNPSSAPSFHSIAPSLVVCPNGCNCARPMTMASPFANPTMTDSGIMVMKRAPPPTVTTPINTPASITEGKSSSTPSPLPPSESGFGRKPAMTAANAPEAPWIMPGRPPKRAQTSPRIQAAWIATVGRTCARKANDTDSGTWAQAMTMPSSTSVLR